MIKYKNESARKFILYYAEKLDDQHTLEILNRGEVKNADEATHLSKFFWVMVDASIRDVKNEVDLTWNESTEFICEKLMYTISGYLERAGYEAQWEFVSDQQDT